MGLARTGTPHFVCGANFTRGAGGAMIRDLVSGYWDAQLPAAGRS
ncbi:MAG TPA: hypothetical protein VLQ29_09140 [Candidatus Dormibacteraeota bacterium]|nr:hypothetical protein [Candidatus Dormibacteraeota bacterium]